MPLPQSKMRSRKHRPAQSVRILPEGRSRPQRRTCSQRCRTLIQTGTDSYRFQATEDERGTKNAR